MIRIAAALLSLMLAAFLGFVGYHKTFSPLVELAKHKAWTVHLWEPLGRMIGVSELLCATALVASIRWKHGRRWVALYLVANQLAAAATHSLKGEFAALPQNFVIIMLAAFLLWASVKQGD
jgi:hypothetical protein